MVSVWQREAAESRCIFHLLHFTRLAVFLPGSLIKSLYTLAELLTYVAGLSLLEISGMKTRNRTWNYFPGQPCASEPHDRDGFALLGLMSAAEHSFVDSFSDKKVLLFPRWAGHRSVTAPHQMLCKQPTRQPPTGQVLLSAGAKSLRHGPRDLKAHLKALQTLSQSILKRKP